MSKGKIMLMVHIEDEVGESGEPVGVVTKYSGGWRAERFADSQKRDINRTAEAAINFVVNQYERGYGS